MKGKREIRYEIGELRKELGKVKKNIYNASSRGDSMHYEQLIHRQEILITKINILNWVLK